MIKLSLSLLALFSTHVVLAQEVPQAQIQHRKCSCHSIFERQKLDPTSGSASSSKNAEGKFEWGEGTKILIVGGHASHDFDRWFNQEDTKTLKKDPPVSVNYTDQPADILAALEEIDILYMSQNQKMADAKVNAAIEAFVDGGGGLLVVHAAIWKNWNNWENYYKTYIGGFSRGHDPYQEFEVKVKNTEHPVTKGLPDSFLIKDELYYHFPDKDANITVLAQAHSKKKKQTYNTIWEVKHPKAKIICITLGHDGAAHQDEKHYQKLLRQAVQYLK